MVEVVLRLCVAVDIEVFGAAVEFDSMEMLASIMVELLGPAPKVKREPAGSETNLC